MSDEPNPFEPTPESDPESTPLTSGTETEPEVEEAASYEPDEVETAGLEPDETEEVLSSEKHGFLDKLATRKGITIIAICIVLFLAVAVVSGILVYNKNFKPTPTFPVLTTFNPPMTLEELAEKYPDYADILLDPELDSAYKDFLIEYQENGVEGALELANKRGMINANNELMVTLEFDTEDTTAAQEQLKGEGISINTASKNLLDIGIPVALIEIQLESDDPAAIFSNLTELEHVTRVRLPQISVPNTGIKINPKAPAYQLALESLPVINATAWQEAGFTGQGMRVGILDFGFDKYKSELGNELPDASMITARSFITGVEIDQSGIEHGTAVAEIIHAIAPDAELVFAAYATDAEFFEAVDWLVSQNVQIINHSGGGAYGPRNGTGDDVQTIDWVVSNNILWVNSSGNSGSRHWRGKFTDTNGDGVHEFFNDGTIGLGFAPFYNTGILVQWDDWGTRDQDLDIFVVDENGDTVFASRNIQDGTNPPFEGVFYEFPDYGPYYLVIVGNNVTRDINIDIFANYADFDPRFIVSEYSILSPSDAESSFTICATNWKSGELTDYSSQGPTVDGRLKPDMCGPSETYSTAFGGEFAGTSNSSPQVAGAATLIRQAFPEMTVDQVKTFLLDRAQDAGTAGPDPQYGYGLLWMGDPPGEETVITAPPVEDPDEPTETPIIIKETREPTEDATEVSDEDIAPPIVDLGDWEPIWLILGGLFCCFSLLVIFGIVLIIVLANRNKKKPRRPVPGRRYPAGYYPPAGTPPMRPGAQQQVRGARPPQPRQPQPGRPPQTPGPQSPAVKLCPKCGTPHAPQARFCPKCGMQFGAPQQPPQPPQPGAQCRYCGQPIRPGAPFCPKCGQKQ